MLDNENRNFLMKITLKSFHLMMIGIQYVSVEE